MPYSSARPGQKSYVGTFGDFKWVGKYYEGELLALSDELLVIPYLKAVTVESTLHVMGHYSGPRGSHTVKQR